MTGTEIAALVLKFGPQIITLLDELRTIGDREPTDAEWQALRDKHQTYEEFMAGG